MRETLQAYTGATKNVSLLAPKAPSLSVGGLTHYNLRHPSVDFRAKFIHFKSSYLTFFNLPCPATATATA